MRPALVRITVLAASLLVAALALVPGASVAQSGEEAQREIEIKMRVGAFRVTVLSDEGNDERQHVLLDVSRGRRSAQYFVPAEVTGSTIKARFGDLGELDYSFAPKGSVSTECFGATSNAAAFDGTFTFTGEHDYIHIDTDHVAGEYKVYPAPSKCPLPQVPRAAVASRAVPYETYVGMGATLTAEAGSRRTRARVFSVSREAGARRGFISGQLLESVGAMTVARGAILAVGSGAFGWDLSAGTATVDPPAPFTGSAHFSRRPGGRPLWTGSLRVPILGGEPIRLAGGAFHAALHRGVPHDD